VGTSILLLVLLAGCAGSGKLPAQPDVIEIPSSENIEVETAPQVTSLTDGRLGFVIHEFPQHQEVWQADFAAAVVCLNAQDEIGAVELLEKVVGQEPGVTAPYIDLAIAYRRLGKPDAAEKNLKKALELVPAHPVASNEYGLLLRKSGRFAEARKVYELALETFPDYFPVRRNLGILCDIYLNDLECADNQYQLYSKAQPGDEKVKLWLVDLQQRLGQ